MREQISTLEKNLDGLQLGVLFQRIGWNPPAFTMSGNRPTDHRMKTPFIQSLTEWLAEGVDPKVPLQYPVGLFRSLM